MVNWEKSGRKCNIEYIGMNTILSLDVCQTDRIKMSWFGHHSQICMKNLLNSSNYSGMSSLNDNNDIIRIELYTASTASL